MKLQLFLNNLPKFFIRDGGSMSFRVRGKIIELEGGVDLIVWYGDDPDKKPPDHYREVKLVII